MAVTPKKSLVRQGVKLQEERRCAKQVKRNFSTKSQGDIRGAKGDNPCSPRGHILGKADGDRWDTRKG